MKKATYHITGWTTERIDAVREALSEYLMNPAACASLDPEINGAIAGLQDMMPVPDGELVFSAGDDHWDQIGPTVEKIMKS